MAFLIDDDVKARVARLQIPFNAHGEPVFPNLKKSGLIWSYGSLRVALFTPTSVACALSSTALSNT